MALREAAIHNRNRVLGLLLLLSVIMYLDRVCISVAGPAMQEALGIGPEGWGWVTGAFTLAYAAFEVPSGAMGDRWGPRKVLTRIVLWWSAFTSLTGAVSSLNVLVATRFLFGIGEAGAAPNMGIVIARWFPLEMRSRAWGLSLMALQVGGAVAPLLVVPVQARWGWRASFFVFGAVGVLWSALWYWWFRDSPQEKDGVAGVTFAAQEHVSLPWGEAMRSSNLRSLMLMAGSVGWSMSFFQSWLGTYLAKGLGFSATGLLWASLPFLVGAFANVVGGFVGDIVVRQRGLTFGRRAVGIAGYGLSTLSLIAATQFEDKITVITLLSFAYGGITLGQPALMNVCLDIGGKFSGAVTGAMNMAAYTGAFVSSVAYGYMVNRYGYQFPFLPMIGFMLVGTLLWFRVRPEEDVIAVR